MVADIRPKIADEVLVMGTPISITPPHEETIETYGIWDGVEEPADDTIAGELQRREPRRRMGIPLEGLGSIPRGTVIAAALQDGEDPVNWIVDGTIETEHDDEIRVLVIRERYF